MNPCPIQIRLAARPLGLIAAVLTAFLVWSSSAAAMEISEFRLRGQGGAGDEYVDLYNESSQSVTVSTADGSAGWAVAASDGVARFVVPNGTVIPSHGHILGANSTAYSLSAVATPDFTFTKDILDNAGIALFDTSNPANFTLANRLDAVGSTSEANSLYKEGAGYPALTPFSINCAFTRILLSGSPKDTGDNAADFLFVDTNGTSAGAGQHLGAPDPHNSSSPILGDNNVAVSALDPSQPTSAAPNFVRSFFSEPAKNSTFGTISIRRLLTNDSGVPLTRLQLRIVDLTTFPSPAGVADLRPLTSTETVVGSTTVHGTTLEQPPSQPNGGGINSNMLVPSVTPATPLQPGASIAVQVLLGIQQTGSYRFCADIEASPAAGGTFADAGATDAGPAGVTQCAPVPAPPLEPTPTPTPEESPAPIQAAPQAQAAPSPAVKLPVISKLSLSRSTFSAAKGTIIRFNLSEAGQTAITISQLTKGRKVGAHCVAPGPGNRGKATCRRAVHPHTFSASSQAGPNSIRFSGKIHTGGRVVSLTPGHYELTARETDAAGNRSKPARLSFRFVP